LISDNAKKRLISKEGLEKIKFRKEEARHILFVYMSGQISRKSKLESIQHIYRALEFSSTYCDFDENLSFIKTKQSSPVIFIILIYSDVKKAWKYVHHKIRKKGLVPFLTFAGINVKF
jgi:hypothetical protein